MIDDQPLHRLAPLLNSVKHANSIILSLSTDEQRATEYSKAATHGTWNEVWDNSDRRKSAKAANDAPAAERKRTYP